MDSMSIPTIMLMEQSYMVGLKFAGVVDLSKFSDNFTLKHTFEE